MYTNQKMQLNVVNGHLTFWPWKWTFK